MIDFIRKLIASMSDHELAHFRTVLLEEESLRAKKRVESGTFSPLTDEEKKLINSGRPVQAIKVYKDRTAVTILEAKNVVEAYRNPHKPGDPNVPQE